MINTLFIKKRYPRAPMITIEIGASINILPKVVFGHHHVGELEPFVLELYSADG